MKYCSVSDVLSVLRIFADDWDDFQQTIPTGLIEQIIDEDSLFVRNRLQSRYDISKIEALDPLPYTIRECTKLRASLTALDRIGVVSTERNQQIQQMLMNNYTDWLNMLKQGNLFDNDGNLLAMNNRARVQYQTSNNLETIKDIYKRGCHHV